MIIIKPIPKAEARYDTLGDWIVDKDGNLIINLPGGADVLADDETFLIALHEMVEAKLCHKRNISQTAVDSFDFSYQGDGEPGDAQACPYRWEHRQAMLIEHLMAHFLGHDDYGQVK